MYFVVVHNVLSSLQNILHAVKASLSATTNDVFRRGSNVTEMMIAETVPMKKKNSVVREITLLL